MQAAAPGRGQLIELGRVDGGGIKGQMGETVFSRAEFGELFSQGSHRCGG